MHASLPTACAVCAIMASAFFFAAAECRYTSNFPSSRESLRPLPSHDLPIIDLIEPAGQVYDPKPEDLDPIRVKERLGSHYDPRCMSAKRPMESLVHPNGTLEFSFKHNKNGRLVPVGRMPRDIRKMNFNYLSLPDGRKLRTKVNQKLKRKFQQFLWAYTYCPVVHIWKDLGIRFWPRWIREGHCHTASSCSFPKGMTCKPSKSVSKVILRWHCKNWDGSDNCGWIQIRYPIIAGCSCSC